MKHSWAGVVGQYQNSDLGAMLHHLVEGQLAELTV